MPKRRNVLIGLGGSIALAGCTRETDDEEEPESEEEDTPTETPEEEQTTPEEQDQLEDPPYEEVLKPDYVDEHRDLMNEFETFSLYLRSRRDGFSGTKYEGVVHFDSNESEALLEVDVSTKGEARTDPNLKIGMYVGPDSAFAMIDPDDGSTRFNELEDQEFDELEGGVLDFEMLEDLALPLQIFPVKDLNTLLSEANLIYSETRNTEYEDDDLNYESHIYEIENFDIIEGDLREYLEGRDLGWIQVGLNKETGTISHFDLRYDDEARSESTSDNRYSSVLYNFNEEKETKPRWVTEAEVALDD